MILNKNNVPDVYTESEDFLCVLRLLDLVANTEKARNKFINIRDAFQCPSTYLALAAKYVDYEYDNQYSEDDNRLIMSVYPTLKRYKGSNYGINLAIKTALRLQDTIPNVEGASINYVYKVDNENAEITVQIACKKYSQKIVELLEYVRPAGYKLSVSRSDSTIVSSENFRVDLISNATDIKANASENDSDISTSRYDIKENAETLKVYEISFNSEKKLDDITKLNIYFDVSYIKEETEYSTRVKLYYSDSAWHFRDDILRSEIQQLVMLESSPILNLKLKNNVEDYLQLFSFKQKSGSGWSSLTFGAGYAEYFDSSTTINTDVETLYTVPKQAEPTEPISISVTGELIKHSEILPSSHTKYPPIIISPSTSSPINVTINNVTENGDYDITISVNAEVTVDTPIIMQYYYYSTQYYQICKLITSKD